MGASADPGETESSIRVAPDFIGFSGKFLTLPLNADLSGGEKKRNEALVDHR